MSAARYYHQGPAAEVLRVGELPTAEPGPGQVRVHLTRVIDDLPQVAKDAAACDLTDAAPPP
jgi:hypothetical protein